METRGESEDDAKYLHFLGKELLNKLAHLTDQTLVCLATSQHESSNKRSQGAVHRTTGLVLALKNPQPLLKLFY